MSTNVCYGRFVFFLNKA